MFEIPDIFFGRAVDAGSEPMYAEKIRVPPPLGVVYLLTDMQIMKTVPRLRCTNSSEFLSTAQYKCSLTNPVKQALYSRKSIYRPMCTLPRLCVADKSLAF